MESHSELGALKTDLNNSSFLNLNASSVTLYNLGTLTDYKSPETGMNVHLPARQLGLNIKQTLQWNRLKQIISMY